MNALTTEQVKAILTTARESSTRDWCMFLLTFRHALRSQEARTLKLDDIDMAAQTIAINRCKGSKSGVQSLDRHKGEPLLDEVVALKSWLKERHEDGSKVLFPSAKGGAMTRILRHSLCSTMAAQHADIYAIQQRAGHVNISNTMIYTHVSDAQASEACHESLMAAFA
jgi:type 1 fimbriae regulatory protein FimE